MFERRFDATRNIAGHRLEWQPFEKFIISGSELVTYADRSIELTYLLPFVPFFPLQAYVGETDNVIMSGDIQYMPQDNIRHTHPYHHYIVHNLLLLHHKDHYYG